MLLENTLMVATQVLILFALMAVGYAVQKFHMLDESGLHQLTNLVLVIASPCVIIKAFQIPFEMSLLSGLLIAAASAILTHLIGALVARLVFRKQPEAKGKVLRFSVVFTNCGFMCLPLLEASLGDQGVFFGSVYIAVFNIILWTYGVVLMAGNRDEVNLRRALLNPGVVTVLLALPLFIFGIQLPSIPMTAIKHLASINSPLAMIVVGAQLALIPLGGLFKAKQSYWASLFRLLIIPGIVMAVLHLFPLNRVLILACLIPAAAPTAATSALFANRFEQDKTLATQIIALTTLFSIITIPLMILFSDLIG